MAQMMWKVMTLTVVMAVEVMETELQEPPITLGVRSHGTQEPAARTTHLNGTDHQVSVAATMMLAMMAALQLQPPRARQNQNHPSSAQKSAPSPDSINNSISHPHSTPMARGQSSPPLSQPIMSAME